MFCHSHENFLSLAFERWRLIRFVMKFAPLTAEGLTCLFCFDTSFFFLLFNIKC